MSLKRGQGLAVVRAHLYAVVTIGLKTLTQLEQKEKYQILVIVAEYRHKIQN